MSASGTEPPLVPGDRPSAAHCHALRVRLPAGTSADDVAAALSEAVRAWWPQDAPERLPRLWTERTPATAGALRAELYRPVAPGSRLRAVLFTGPGPGAETELVLTAHRADLDMASLRLVADVLLGRVPADRPRPLRPDWPGPRPSPPSRPDGDHAGPAAWAEGDPTAGTDTATLAVPVPATGGAGLDPALLVVATAVVQARYEGVERPVIGVLTVLPGRPESALGPFEGNVLVPVDVGGGRPAELVDRARQAITAPQAWCDPSTYAELTSGGHRVRAGVLAVPGGAGRQGPDGLPTVLPCLAGTFDLTLVPDRGAGGEDVLTVHHRLAEIDAGSAARFARHVVTAYTRLAAPAPEDRPAVALDIDLLDGAEREQLVRAGGPATTPEWPPYRLDEAFARQAARRPDAVALVCEGDSITYRELDSRAERMAVGLLAQGVTPGERVGLCLGRSPDLVVAMLAVLKADAVYVPMDPAHPADRLAYTAEDAGLRLVVTDVDALPATSARAVRPDEVAAAGADGTLAPPGRGPGEAAYVIYTSGSTGRPKGVVVPHRNVVALIDATREDFGLGPDDTWTLFHSSAFDFSVWEIWGPLLTGGSLVVVPYWVSRSPGEFRDLLVERRVSVLSQTPSAFAQLIEADRGHGRPLSLRLVVFGGEPLDTRVLRTWFDRYPESACRLVNMFGITETTVHVTAQTVTRREVLAGSRSVGPALPGWYLYVLDERGRPVPFGAPGEIHVGGAGVALEYLNRPELTAERFLPDPFRGGRMYRSGDRGRLWPDGRLEHLGRLDNQVKIRGFRIELDEIRNVLLDDPAVTAAAVLVAGEGAQDAAAARIDAYVVLDGDDTAAVRGRAATLLPEYMLPATVTALPALPLTANGKLDTRRLPAPAAVRRPPAPAAAVQDPPTARRHSRGPSAELSAQLAEVWEAVLGVPVGPDDNFFSLGGNSLYAVRVAAAMSARRLPALPMRELYLHPTVRRLARALAPAAEA
ncbi:non-ribosomal peptide synthetase [Streptomyces fuscichromogenes]|uniref:Carrier domain-containing protein n=1 Tax=Streptomyces fuscichromogenes TaxID=1324013 RepID=A0A917XNG6_9ACTN|nr:amino acid adenylation domain-containing protein [Streptomyces fuscichromogenes]GGN42437.1 hypothetical protein GCM10011578_091720 [Streptomyces fuscichromogenes]